MTIYISVELRRQLRRDAGSRCGYCRSAEELTGAPLTIEHIVPIVSGGPTLRENLWLACHRCNEFKSDRTAAIDPETQQLTALYNPRTQVWQDHFSWSLDGSLVVPLTAAGRATVSALQLNNTYVVAARRFWVEAGRHPPGE